ncbi:MAG: ribonuclease H-like domain-containing protein [Acidobacteriota bacterium]
MDLKDRLEILKKIQREKTERSFLKDEKIAKEWENIQKEELSKREKLEKLIEISQKIKEKTAQKEAEKIETFNYFEIPDEFEHPFNADFKLGKILIRDGFSDFRRELGILGKDLTFHSLNLNETLFLDLETTGLSGGTGVIPFLIGLGFYEEEKYKIKHYFIRDLKEERYILEKFQCFLQERNFSGLITYNGKNFDLPILEARFILNRVPNPFVNIPHLDFLYPARKIWKYKYQNCSLSYLGEMILNIKRDEDIPREEIPLRYSTYLRTGNFSLIEPVIYHNELDLIALLGLVVTASLILKSPENQTEDPIEIFGISRIYETVEDEENCLYNLKMAVERGLPGELNIIARKKLALNLKRKNQWKEAIKIWDEIQQIDFESAVELAKYYEHKEKKIDRAFELVESLYEKINDLSFSKKDELEIRKNRLIKKLIHLKKSEGFIGK